MWKGLKSLLLPVIIFCSDVAMAQSAGRPAWEDAGDIVSGGLKDKNGNLWFVTGKRGAYKYDGQSFTHFSEKEGISNISCVYEDNAGILWFGTVDGAYKYDGKTFSKFFLPTHDSSSARSAHYSRFPKDVNHVLQDKAGNFWFTTTLHGVYRYDGKSFKNFLPHETLQCIAEDKDGAILVGSWRGSGVFRFDGSEFKPLYGFSDGMIFCMQRDKAGNLWIGTRQQGADRYDGKSVTNFDEKSGLNNNVSCIFEDSKGRMWFGSDPGVKGVTRGDAIYYDGKTFVNVTSQEIITTKSDLLYSVRTILEDNAGNIWLGSRDGMLLRYNGKTFTDFSKEISK